jgi:hypothetical protein
LKRQQYKNDLEKDRKFVKVLTRKHVRNAVTAMKLYSLIAGRGQHGTVTTVRATRSRNGCSNPGRCRDLPVSSNTPQPGLPNRIANCPTSVNSERPTCLTTVNTKGSTCLTTVNTKGPKCLTTVKTERPKCLTTVNKTKLSQCDHQTSPAV